MTTKCISSLIISAATPSASDALVNWRSLSATDILGDINAALVASWDASAEWRTGSFLIPYSTYLALCMQHPLLRLLLRSRKTRRPAQFTRKLRS